jgi:hypothetical protein
MPKVRSNWWMVQQGFLRTTLDPSDTLGAAAEEFPDEYTPTVYLTGDGHRDPPFAWTTQNAWPGFFRDLIEADGLCVHVEEYPENVTVGSVPDLLRPLVTRGRVFGWEPAFYRTIQAVMERCREVAGEDRLRPRDISSLARAMIEVSQAGYLRNEAIRATTFNLTAMNLIERDDLVPMDRLVGYRQFLVAYINTAMRLRVEINDVIGGNVQRVIDRFPDNVHLVTCGNAHLVQNPLYQYIDPPPGCFGVVDTAQN